MKTIKILTMVFATSLITLSCSNNDDDDYQGAILPDFSGTYEQQDQMGRPAINTVFVSPDNKDMFNTTIPSMQNATFQSMFQTNLLALSPAYADNGENALMQDVAGFTGLLATDVLNVSLDGETTFYDGTTTPATLLTGRALTDDVITVELLLIFGGEDFMENPGLSNDNVSSNDKTFLPSFPYLASPW